MKKQGAEAMGRSAQVRPYKPLRGIWLLFLVTGKAMDKTRKKMSLADLHFKGITGATRLKIRVWSSRNRCRLNI